MNKPTRKEQPKPAAAAKPEAAKAPMTKDELSSEQLDKATGGLLPAVGPEK
jgi:hypothetical protein